MQVIKRVLWGLVSVKFKVFWNVTPCSLAGAYQYFWWNLTVYLILEDKDLVPCGTAKQYLSKWGECVCQCQRQTQSGRDKEKQQCVQND